MNAYTSSPPGTTYDDNGTTKDLTALGPIGTWCTSGITNMQSMFQSTSFNEDINAWDTSSVTTMHTMFQAATVFNQPIGSWDTSSVIDMNSMFQNAPAFNQPIQNWDTSSVTNMNAMFLSAHSFTQNLCAWKDSPAVSNDNDANMFNNLGGGGPKAPDTSFDATQCVSVDKLFDPLYLILFGCSHSQFILIIASLKTHKKPITICEVGTKATVRPEKIRELVFSEKNLGVRKKA